MKNTGMIVKFISVAIIAASLAAYQSAASVRAETAAQIKAEEREAEKRRKAAQKAAADKAAAEAAAKYADGIYEGVGEGYGGEIKVRLTVKDGEIVTIDPYEHSDEDDEYFGLAKALIGEVIEANDTDTADIVSGATFSSEGLIEAIQDAAGKAVKK